jgi:hypothetical protein
MATTEAYIFTVPGISGGSPSQQVYRFTSGAVPLTVSGQVYAPIPIRRDIITSPATGRTESQRISVRVPVSHDFARLWDLAPPQGRITLAILRVTLGDEANAQQVFSGVVISDSQDGPWHVLDVVPTVADTSQMLPRGVYSPLCRWALYGPGCNVNEEDHRKLGTRQGEDVDAREITLRVVVSGSGSIIALVNEERWLGGQLAGWVGDLSTGSQLGERRVIYEVGEPTFVSNNTWDITFRVQYWFTRLAALPSTWLLVEGCRKSEDICNSQFDNVVNFGGFPFLSSTRRTPFGTGYRDKGDD